MNTDSTMTITFDPEASVIDQIAEAAARWGYRVIGTPEFEDGQDVVTVDVEAAYPTDEPFGDFEGADLDRVDIYFELVDENRSTLLEG